MQNNRPSNEGSNLAASCANGTKCLSMDQPSLPKRNGLKTSMTRLPLTTSKKMPDKVLSREQHDGRNTLRHLSNGSSVASLKLGIFRGTRQNIQSGQSDRSHQSTTKPSKEPMASIVNKNVKTTAEPKDNVFRYNLRSRVQKAEGLKGSPLSIQTKEKTSGPKIQAPAPVPRTRTTKPSAPLHETHESVKKTGHSSSRSENLMSGSIKKITHSSQNEKLMHENIKKTGTSTRAEQSMHESAKTMEAASCRAQQPMSENTKKSRPPSSRAKHHMHEKIKETKPSSIRTEQLMREAMKTTKPSSHAEQLIHGNEEPPKSSEINKPVYYIAGADLEEECEPVEQECLLCEKPLSEMPYNDETVSDDESHSDYELDYYMSVRKSNVLPSIDILACGHAFHSECLQLAVPEQQRTDPDCLICLSMK